MQIYPSSTVPETSHTCSSTGDLLRQFSFYLFDVFYGRKATKENLVETSSDITESLLSISRMMAQQVKQSEESISTLGKSTLFVQHNIALDMFSIM